MNASEIWSVVSFGEKDWKVEEIAEARVLHEVNSES